MNSNIDVHSCRICFTEDKNNTSLLDSFYKSRRYCDWLEEYCGIIIPKEGCTGPLNICCSCTNDFLTVINFISKCRQADERLQEISNLKLEQNFKNAVNTIKEEDNSEIKIENEYSDGPRLFQDSSSDEMNIKKLRERVKKKVKKKKKRLKRTVVCAECGLNVPSKSALIIHNRSHTGERPFRCPYCESCFPHQGTLKDHISRKHCFNATKRKRGFICDTCGKMCKCKTELVTHIRVHTKERPFICPQCSRGFAQIENLKQHLRVHTGEQPYLCKDCGRKFSHPNALKRHQVLHVDVRVHFDCPMCNKIFKSKAGQAKHITNAHDIEHVCDKCGEIFKNRITLKAHMRAKHSELVGFCDTCQKQFSDLPKHVKVHSGDTPFHCTLCPKKFTHQRALTRHFHLHVDKFICNVGDCTKTFSMQCKLDFHILKFHSTETPYACQYCSKKLYRAVDLTIHLKRCLELKKES